jgi:hypothetical protein
MCGDDSTEVEAPAVDPAQEALEQEQLLQAQSQSALEQELLPAELQSMGYEEVPGTLTAAQTADQASLNQQIAALQAQLAAPSTTPAPQPGTQAFDTSQYYGTTGTAGVQGIAGQPSTNAASIEQQIAALQGQEAAIQPGETIQPMTAAQLEANMTPNQLAEYEVQGATANEELEALQGTLPIPANITQGEQQQTTQVENQLANQLGPNWAQSTPGQEELSLMQQQQEAENASWEQSMAGLGGQLSASSTGAANQTTGTNQGVLNSVNSASLGLIGAEGSMMQPYEYQQGLQLQANQANAQYSAMADQGIGQMLGDVAGLGMMALMKPSAPSQSFNPRSMNNY